MKKTVWLASWFPNENDPLVGDFIKRHAEAVSLFQPVHVIHVEKIKYGSKTIKTTDPLFTNLTYIVKYYSVWYLAGIERLYSYLYSLWLYHSLLKQYIKENGKPDLVHVHVTLRCGWVALYYKLVHKIPYIITEHNAGYMPQAKLYHKSAVNILNVLPLKLIIKNAATVTTVSKALLNALKQQFNLNNLQVIYNVVNTDIFFPAHAIQENKRPVFLHISTLTSQKNPEQMFTAFALLRQQYNTNFTLCIVAPKKQHLVNLCKELHIDDCIEWHAETSQQNIAALMHHANALVLYSNFESFGCVNIEAMACGLPVIVSGLEVFKEYLQPHITAWFAEPGNPEQLALTMHEFLLASKQSPQLIAQKAQAFSYQTIGEKFIQLYETINKP